MTPVDPGLRAALTRVAQVDRLLELNTIHGDGDPAMDAVTAGFDETGLVDVAEDDAAEDGAVLVGVFGKRDDAEREASWFRRKG